MADIVTQIYQFMHPNGNVANVQLEFDGKRVKVKTTVVEPPTQPPKPKLYQSTMLCPFCNHQLDEELYNGAYGCDTGCEYVSIEIECPNCHKILWDSGTFGYYGNRDEKAEYRAEFVEEFAEWLEINTPERIAKLPPQNPNISKEEK